jgi:hypothetical protein
MGEWKARSAALARMIPRMKAGETFISDIYAETKIPRTTLANIISFENGSVNDEHPLIANLEPEDRTAFKAFVKETQRVAHAHTIHSASTRRSRLGEGRE